MSTLQSRVNTLVQEIHPYLLVQAKEDDGRIEEAMVVPLGTTSQTELLLVHDVRAEHAEGEGQAGDLAKVLMDQVKELRRAQLWKTNVIVLFAILDYILAGIPTPPPLQDLPPPLHDLP